MTCILDDDEADIEAEIQRELDALGDDSLFTENVENSLTAGKAVEVSVSTKCLQQSFPFSKFIGSLYICNCF